MQKQRTKTQQNTTNLKFWKTDFTANRFCDLVVGTQLNLGTETAQLE
jgi:hypothetical protein